MGKKLLLLSACLGALVGVGCKDGENADMPKDDPVIGKPAEQGEAKPANPQDNPVRAGKGGGITK